MNEVTVILWRHAPTPDNAAGRLQGRTDTPPADAGLRVGRVAALDMLEKYGAPDRVFSSPLQRAIGTAQQLVQVAGAGQQVEVEPGINQRSYGVWEGRTLAELHREFPHELAVRNAGGDPDVLGWEAGAVVGARVANAITTRAQQAVETQNQDFHIGSQNKKGGPLLVFTSHGSAISTGLIRLLKLNPNQELFGHLLHANWVELRFAQQQWSVQRYNAGPN